MPRTADSAVFSKGLGATNLRLFRNLALVAVVSLGLCFAALVYFDKRLMDVLSHQLIDKTTLAINSELSGYFSPLEQGLIIVQDQIERIGLFSGHGAEDFYRAMEPFLDHYPYVSGAIAGNSQKDTLG